ncbi:MAG: dicarboxylate/amino acid:cation symporter [Clostridium sp.]|nr:dicarboxylate/amino acid:cation symporter [Clostridium sp.]MCM1444209.1 dicarboxylate/amino acid:cation symporter [Candidatus Amulumruptor caecigallinarius]
MKRIWKNYKQTIILLTALILGVVTGLIFKQDAAIVSPLGDLFLNLLFVVVVPLIILTITTSIAKMKEPRRLSKIVKSIIVVFVVTSLISVIVGLISTYSIKLVNNEDSRVIKDMMVEQESSEIKLNILQKTVDVISVNDFYKLLSKENIIAIVIFALILGVALRMAKEKADPLVRFLDSANTVIMQVIKIIMYYAPIGIFCYTASLIGTYGSAIAIGFAKTFVIYFIVSILFYFIIYSLYAYIAAGIKGVKLFWKNIIPTTLTSIATCSSAASIPVNIEGAKKIGVSEDIANTIIPLGTSFHKDGSIIGSVFKIMFLVSLFGFENNGILQIAATALIANLLVTAVPIGGGTISEMMILSLLGYPVAALPLLTIVATIIDAPATMLNVVGDTSSAMLVSRMVDGRNWINRKLIKND